MKKPMPIFGLILLLASAGLAVFLWMETERTTEDQAESAAAMEEEAEDDGHTEEISEQREKIKGSISEQELQEFEEQGLNPFGEDRPHYELTDDYYQEYIHGMSHQKVKASKKWGFYEIHPQRINWLLEGMEKVALDHEDVYRRILLKWKEGDFSTADADHNAVWELQGGTVGKASGVMDPEEEQAYLESEKE
ncbi:DUF6241 domain-containing protein [Virgibacillus xinjiangensis]|uniref:DUF6241 domain-containing protein n=1 Tax=Virgibacillus xinjiangensis TaxID=393090 RepID=A0ABV7CYK7_9BACI